MLRTFQPALTRRQFTLTAGSLAAGLCAGRATAAAKWNMRLAGSTSMFGTLSFDEACRRFAALGFEAIDIWHAGFKAPHLEEIETRLKAAGVRAILAKHRLKLCAVTAYLTEVKRVAPLLEELGGGLAVRGSAALRPGETLAGKMKLFFERLKPEIELAEKHNFYLAIENHSNSLLNSLESFKAFVDLNRSPRVGIALAPFHLQREQVPMEQVFAIAGRQMRFFYAWQLGQTLDQLPGLGPLDFTPWLAQLVQAGYQGYVNPFTHFHAEPDELQPALAKSCDYLRKCCAGLS